MNSINKFIALVLLFFGSNKLEAQDKLKLEIGATCPNFSINNIKYFNKSSATLNDFQGKWLILDFWNSACSACISSFPRSSELQRKFKDKIQYMYVGDNRQRLTSTKSEDRSIRQLYDIFRVKQKLNLAVAFDSTLCKQFNILGCPYIVVISPDGIIRGITSEISEQNLEDFLAGKMPTLMKIFGQSSQNNTKFNPKLPFLTDGNGGKDTDFIYRSVLFRWDSELPRYFPIKIGSAKLFQVAGVDLITLYNYAFWGYQNVLNSPYYGYYYLTPILEIKDSSLFIADFATGNNLFCYSESIPTLGADSDKLKLNLQLDLRKFFGYDARIEERELPYFRLIVSNHSKGLLKTKGGKAKGESTHIRYSVKNYPIQNLIETLKANFQSQAVFLDETDINFNIDLDLECFMEDLNDVTRALRKCGLDLVESKKKFKVLVIKDSG